MTRGSKVSWLPTPWVAIAGLGQCISICFIFAGGGFQLVSCPHYLGEIIIYAGLLLTSGLLQLLPWLIFLWVVSQTPLVHA